MIEILNNRSDELKKKISRLYEDLEDKRKTDLDQWAIAELDTITTSSEFQGLKNHLNNGTYFNSVKYEDLNNLLEEMNFVFRGLEAIKERKETQLFYMDGYNLDIDAIKTKFKNKKLSKQFPNFNFKRLKELYVHPPTTIKTRYSEEYIIIDDFVFRKYLVGIIQMVLDEMDLLSVISGGEGSGKSTHVTQLMSMVYYILTELRIVDYKFEIKDCFFNTLENFLRKEDELFEERFRILALDEGNELHRQNWHEDDVKVFFQRLRRNRFNQRIMFICIPVLGELLSNVVSSRVNFIHEMLNFNDRKTGSLNKGRVNFYINPRGDKIYSFTQKREITRDTIKKELEENLKDKNYLKGMPKNILIKSYRCNGVWGFPKELYIKELKDTNKTFQVAKRDKMSALESYILFSLNITPKLLDLSRFDARYATFTKMMNRISKRWVENPEEVEKFKLVLSRKQEEKDRKRKDN